MPLTAQFASYFDSGIQQRGANYFRAGCVRVDSSSASRVVATVKGSERYSVKLVRAGRNIDVSCTCPYYNVDFCKHIWAVMLAAAGHPLVQGKNLALVHRDSRDFEDEVEAEDESASEQSGVAMPDSESTPPAPDWRQQMAGLLDTPSFDSDALDPWPSTRELRYLIDVAGAGADDDLVIDVLWRDLKADGSWSKPKPRYLQRAWQRQVPDADDRYILASLAGAAPIHGQTLYGQQSSSAYGGTLPFRYRLTDPQPRILVPLLCRTGRCHLRLPTQVEDESLSPALTWQSGEPWQFHLEVRRSPEGERYAVHGLLRRGEERLALTAPILVSQAGILCTREWAAFYEHHGAFGWIALLREQGQLQIPLAQADEFLAELLRQPISPPLDLPEELRYEQVVLTPRARLSIKRPEHGASGELLHGELSFDYGGVVVAHAQPDRGMLQPDQRRILMRDAVAERAAAERLLPLGWRWVAPTYLQRPPRLELATRNLSAVVQELTAEGWYVEADGKVYRSADRFELGVSSGVDWFDLRGAAEFGEVVAQLPELLAAMRRGESLVQLGDGSFGVLPESWLKQFGLLAGLGEAQGDHVRFKRTQAALLDTLLAAQPEARCDAHFTQVRAELRNFAGITPMGAPAGFAGALRPYQREALGWFDFLRRFGFGGCLADDMGLGKTVQVLAMLEGRRELRAGTSLAVVPKSLIFNWKQESARFAPQLRVLDHTGIERLKGCAHFGDYDLVLTTYGTLRNDAADFKSLRFDYVILDEAQAIKNAASVSAKAARLLQADHRLALSGTPIENHLGELWSLFEFLNPGMLGAASVFRMTDAVARNPDEETRKLLKRALRPVLLRRTKEQVLPELPAKVEQTLYCELETRQRLLYDELREHYRATLLKRVHSDGIGRSSIQILEALLRLRQAAIHPGLLDPARVKEPSAKLDMLLPRVLEVIEEGHKALVFSQFTGMLAILRPHLDRAAVAYEYLDGKTRDRQACVERFQTDPDCKLFLISLKAGGVGLNLTAAQYVFLLDPWWNPAVEAQAIDRAHRIGQSNQVFAYRLIARDTVEEKVLELQNTKRDLADAIVGANEGLMRGLGREDLELLLS